MSTRHLPERIGDLPAIGRPANSALLELGVTTLDAVAARSEAELLASMHCCSDPGTRSQAHRPRRPRVRARNRLRVLNQPCRLLRMSAPRCGESGFRKARDCPDRSRCADCRMLLWCCARCTLHPKQTFSPTKEKRPAPGSERGRAAGLCSAPACGPERRERRLSVRSGSSRLRGGCGGRRAGRAARPAPCRRTCCRTPR